MNPDILQDLKCELKDIIEKETIRKAFQPDLKTYDSSRVFKSGHIFEVTRVPGGYRRRRHRNGQKWRGISLLRNGTSKEAAYV